MHLYTSARVSRDVDAAFSHRIALPQDLRIGYRDADGKAQTLYLDYQYNDSLVLLHEEARRLRTSTVVTLSNSPENA
jgi:hypothetical protein